MFKYVKEYRWADMQQMRRNNRAKQLRTDQRMDGKVCVVTGCTSGVGWESAVRLAAHGARLVMVNRDRDKSERICKTLRTELGAECRYLLADFSDLSQVRATADTLIESCGQIDLLVNNAGMHSTKLTRTPSGLETVFCVNHLASFTLTWKLIDTMRRSAPSRIIQVNSQGHRFGGLNAEDLSWQRRHYTGLRGYGASKTAQLLTVWEFADRLQGSGVTINAMHPGAVKSNLGGNNGILYRWFKENVTDRWLDDPRIAGEAIHYLATAPELERVSGRYFNLTHPEKPAPHALDREMGRRIWQLSLQMAELA